MIPMRRIFFWHRNRRVRNIFWEQTVMEEICFQEFWWEVQQVFMRRSCLFRSLRLQELICGWCGGIADTVLMRISDLFLAFPSLVFALAVAGVLGGGIQNAIIALAVIGWPKFARLARGLTLAQKDSPYLMAVKMSGSSVPKILFKHILPNIAGQILVTAVLDIGTMMMELAGLSFLGLGVQPPAAEWGSMINDGRSMLQISPWMVLAPGVAIFITVMIFNLLGDTLRDYMDPKQRAKNKREEKNK